MKVKVKGHSYSLLNVESNKYEQSLNFIHKEKKEDSDELEVISDGTTNEEVLECLIDRMKYLNKRVPCRENERAIEHLAMALSQLNRRTAGRELRNVEGTEKE